MNAREMSSMCTIGRHAMPSLFRCTLPVVNAHAVRLLSTRSNRSRGDTPYAVALRGKVGVKLSSASFITSFSTRTFDIP